MTYKAPEESQSCEDERHENNSIDINGRITGIYFQYNAWSFQSQHLQLD